jgi:hypothetical protein
MARWIRGWIAFGSLIERDPNNPQVAIASESELRRELADKRRGYRYRPGHGDVETGPDGWAYTLLPAGLLLGSEWDPHSDALWAGKRLVAVNLEVEAGRIDVGLWERPLAQAIRYGGPLFSDAAEGPQSGPVQRKPRRGRDPEKSEAIAGRMRKDVTEGRIALEDLRVAKQTNLERDYGASRKTVNDVRNMVVTEFDKATEKAPGGAEGIVANPRKTVAKARKR